MKYRNIVLIIFLGLALISQCTFEEPVLPRWVTPFVIPLAQDKVIFSERFVKDSSVVTRGDSIFLDLHGDIEPETITPEDLSISGVDSTNSFSIETIELDSIPTLSTGFINITDPLPFLSNFLNQTVPVPDTTFSSMAFITDTTNFISMKVRNGSVKLTVYNNLPFTLAPENQTTGSIEISVFNDGLGTHVADISIQDTIPPGGIGEGTAPIASADGWVAIPLRLEYSVHILADNIFVTQDSLNAWNFRVDLNFIDLEVDEITGRVETQSYSNEWHVSVEEEENKVIEATINSGEIQLVFYNRLPISTNISYTLPDLKDATGQSFQDSFHIDSNDSAIQNLTNLAGYRIVNSLNPGQAIDSLTIISSISTDPGFVHLIASDEIRVRLNTTDIQFSYLKGYLVRDTLDIDPLTESDIIDYEDFEGGFKLQGAQFILEIDNHITIDTLLFTGYVTAYHRNENNIFTDSAKIAIIDQPVLPDDKTTILLEGPEVDSLINILPTDFTASGIVIYGGFAEVSTGDTIGGNYIFSTPFMVNIIDPISINLDPDTLYNNDIDRDLQNAAGDEIKSALLTAEISNASPMSGQLYLFVNGNPFREDIYDTTNIIDSLEFYKIIEIPAATIDPLTGFVNEPGEGTIDLSLSRKELKLFQHPPLQVGLQLNLNQTNGFVLLRGSDYLQFRGVAEITVLFKDE